MKKYSVIIIGAGSRGLRYAGHMNQYPEKYQVVAVAEPVKHRRDYLKKLCGMPKVPVWLLLRVHTVQDVLAFLQLHFLTS